MKVLLVVSGKRLGGNGQVCVDYARLLVARGHDVVMCMHPKSNALVRARDQGLEGVKMVASRVVTGSYAHYNPLKLIKGRSIIVDNRINVVVMLNSKVLPLFARIARGRCPVAVHCATYLYDQFLPADAPMFVTQGMVDGFRQFLIDKSLPDRPVYCVPNPLSIPVAPQPVARDPAGPSVTIGALGRMFPQKGFHVLLRAASVLKEQDVPFRLVVGGDGPERSALQRLSEELGLAQHVDFPGWISNREEFFAQVDIFCLPSLSEPFGLVVTEAMARGCPVIVSDTDGPLTSVDNGVSGLVVEKGSVNAWALALQRLIGDPPLATKLATAAQVSVVQRFGDEVMGDLLETTLETVIRDYRKGRR